MTVRLEVSDLSVRFDGIVALERVSFHVQGGQLVGLIGPNGAGKTTLIDAVSGFVRSEGSVVLEGEPLDRLRPHQRAARGVRRTFQSLDLFQDLTIRENVAVGTGGSDEVVTAALEASGLSAIADRLPRTVPVSVQRTVSLARAVAAAPRLLLLDEIAAGIGGDERAGMLTRIREVVSSGTSVLLVDHDLAFVTELADRIVVLDAGRVIADGPSHEVRRNERVVGALLGRA
ncbi:MAG TPA: ATP-binding cassette domain-containing protein [Acidimicrobiales bacterium]|nr:ATP-binding cassette domain-containing protein [Acidimicrobiales bacterium]